MVKRELEVAQVVQDQMVLSDKEDPKVPWDQEGKMVYQAFVVRPLLMDCPEEMVLLDHLDSGVSLGLLDSQAL